MTEIQARFKLDRPDYSLDIDVALPGTGVSALFGPSGAGKTSCLRAIAGLERAHPGYVEINGSVWQDDARNFFMPTHDRPLGFVFQEASLFPHMNVRRNLEYGMKRVAEARRRVPLDYVVELLGIGSLMERIPESLSGGERQRVAIARAILKDAAILVLDEATSSLDSESELYIQDALKKLMKGRTTLVVAHRLSTIMQMDRIVVINGGTIVEEGKHKELVKAKKGLYQKLWEIQAGGFAKA